MPGSSCFTLAGATTSWGRAVGSRRHRAGQQGRPNKALHSDRAAWDRREAIMIQKVTPYLWFDGQAENAARFYVSLLPDSRIEKVTRAPAAAGPLGVSWSSRSPASGSSA